jgi:hypothetical protein
MVCWDKRSPFSNICGKVNLRKKGAKKEEKTKKRNWKIKIMKMERTFRAHGCYSRPGSCPLAVVSRHLMAIACPGHSHSALRIDGGAI